MIAISDRVEILKLAAQGVPSDVLAIWFPYPRAAISRAIRGGPKSRCRKLCDADAETIRQRHATGETVVALASTYGVHRNSIHRILAGTTHHTTSSVPSSCSQ